MTVLVVGLAPGSWLAEAPPVPPVVAVDRLPDAGMAAPLPGPMDAVLLVVPPDDSSTSGPGNGLRMLSVARDLYPTTPLVVAVPAGGESLGRAALSLGAEAYVVIDADPPAAVWRAVEAAMLRPGHTTALREAKERAEEVSRLKDKFISLVAHDLRGPLGAIMGLLELMLQRTDIPLPDAHRDTLRFIVTNGRTLLNVVEDLLDLSRLQTGKIIPDFRFIDAAYAVELALLKVGLLAQQKSVVMHNQVVVGTRLHTDPALFGQVMQNLLSNAIKFSHPGSAVVITAQEAGGQSRLMVRDHGVGIPPERVEKLFRLEEKTSTPGTVGEQGTGFGLPLCAQIMEALGGSLEVDSTPGQGSTVTAAQPARRPRVLVVDDDPFFLRILHRRLAALGADVIPAGNGLEALARLDDAGPAPPDLVLADLAMPEMDGFALLAALKGESRWAGIPVIVITGDTDAAARHRALSLGAEDFTVKPCPDEDFIPRVRRHIG